MSRKTVYAIASGKGGVGKTTTTVNVGTALAGAGNTVAVVDADLGMANLAGLVSLSPDATTLHEVLAGEASVEAATYELADGIVAVPSGADLETYADVDATGLRDVAARLREEFDYVLLDVGAGVSHESVLPLGLADDVVLVTTPEPASVRDASKTTDLTERAEGSVAGLVITRVRDDRQFDFEGIAGRVGVPLLGTVPEDDAVRDSVYSGTPVVVDAPESPAAVAYRRIAKRLVGDATGDAAPSEATGSGEAAQSAETEGPDSTDRPNDVSSGVSGIEEDDEGNGRRDGSAAVRDTPTGEVTADAESSNAESEAETGTETPSEAEASGGAEAGAGADADPVEPSGADDGTGSGTETDAVSAGDAGEERDPDAAAEPETDAAETGGESAAPPASEEGVTIPDAEGPSDDDDTEGVTISEAEATQGEGDDINEDAIPFGDRESTPPGVGEDDEDDEDDDDGFFGRLLG